MPDKNNEISYHQVLKHMFRHNLAVSALLIIVQTFGLVMLFSALPKNMTVIEVSFLTLMILTFYVGSAFIYISQYKTKLKTGTTDPVWQSRYNKMTLLIALAVAVFAIINIH